MSFWLFTVCALFSCLIKLVTNMTRLPLFARLWSIPSWIATVFLLLSWYDNLSVQLFVFQLIAFIIIDNSVFRFIISDKPWFSSFALLSLLTTVHFSYWCFSGLSLLTKLILYQDKRKEPHPRRAALFMSTDKLFYNYNALRAICQAFFGLLSLWQCNYIPKLWTPYTSIWKLCAVL